MRRLVMKANVVLPSDLAREKYVDYCYRTHSVSVMTESGDFLKNCPVAYNFCGVNEGIMYSLNIPESSDVMGTRVVVLYLEEQGMGIVIGCLQDGSNMKLDEEYQFKAIRQKDGNSFSIIGSGLRGVLDLIAVGNNSNGGKIRMKAFTKEQEGELEFATNFFKIRATESFLLEANSKFELLLKNKVVQEEFTSFVWELGVGITLNDEFGNTLSINKDGWSLDGETINLGKTNLQPAVKGDTLENLLTELVTALEVMTVGTAVGPSTVPINIASFTALKSKLNTFKSSKVNLQ